MILLLTGCSESKKLSTNQSEDNNQIKYKSKDITINENLLKENIKKISGKWKTWNMILKKTVIVVKTGKC